VSDDRFLLDQLMAELPYATQQERDQLVIFTREQADVTRVTEGAALINGQWIPKSLIRIMDDEEGILIYDWVARKRGLI
jgi:hypothetical protein